MTGIGNTAIGTNALLTSVNGIELCAVGFESLYNNTSNYNTAIGYHAMFANTTGFANFAAGDKTLDNNISGGLNTAVGNNALGINTTGGSNTGIGADALSSNLTGSKNTALGYSSDVGQNFLTNATAIGYNATVQYNNVMRLGDVNVLYVETQNSFTTVSDGRFKTNVTEEVKGLDFIKRLRPVVYNFDTKRFNEFLMQDLPDSIRRSRLDASDYTLSTSIRQTGFIAQEVEKAAADAGYDFNGVFKPGNEKDHYSLSYDKFVVPLVKAIQEQQGQIEELKNEITLLKALIKK